MMLETILRRIALGCAFVLLLGIMGDRTTWIKTTGRAQSMTDGAIYNWATTLTGLFVLIALAIALNTRPRLIVPLIGLGLAMGALGLASLTTGIFVWAAAQGKVWYYGGASDANWLGDFAGDMGAKWTVYPAQGPFIFAPIAIIGALALLGLCLMWISQSRSRKGQDIRHGVVE